MKRAAVVIGAALLVVSFITLLAQMNNNGEPGLGLPIPLSSIAAEVIFLDASDIVQRGGGRVTIVRITGNAELIPHHFSDEDLGEPQTVEHWAEQLRAPVIFNAGQFDENLAHLGWLKKDGHFIVPHQHGAWQGLLLSGPIDGGAWARIADLKQADAGVEARYRNAIQSMMLFDDQGRIRVRRSGKAACRTVIGEDERGRISIIVTEGAVTLASLAAWLQQQDLGLVRAMNLDGGIESQLMIDTPELKLIHYGQYGTGNPLLQTGAGTIRYPLPAVIALRPARETAKTALRP